MTSSKIPILICENCRDSHVFTEAPCIAHALLMVRGGEVAMTEQDMRERLARLDTEALWNDVGPIIDNLLGGEYDVEVCRTCGEPNDDGEGWDGECGNCADKTAQRHDAK